MGIDRKKQNEMSHFKIFQSLCSELPKGELVHNDSPDFKINRLGIEHTEIFIEEKIQEHWHLQQKVVHSACSKLSERIKPLWVTVFFDYDHPIDIESVSCKLAELVESSLESGDNIEIEYPGISQISVVHIKKGAPEHRWKPAQCGYGCRGDLFVKKLKSCVEKKTEKHSRYIENCDTCWLLVTCNHTIPSQMFHISRFFFRDRTFDSPFEKIFLLELFQKKLYEITTTDEMVGTAHPTMDAYAIIDECTL